jgi:protein involved in polysaccharide export with SLBB domain
VSFDPVPIQRAFSIQFLILTFSLLGLAHHGMAQDISVASADRIHPGDLIEIDELGGFDYDWRGRLNPEGYLAGFSKVADPIFGRCRSPQELAESVRTAYSKVLRDPRVRVRILDRSERSPAYFEGAIRQPMRLQIRRDVHLRELIVIGGGFTDRASGEVTVLRPENLSCESPKGEPTKLHTVKVADILSGDRTADLKILSGDIVTVQEVQPVYVIGGIGRPGKQDWRDGATVSRVIAAAGGVSKGGVAGSVSIFRRESGDSKVIDADLDAITAGAADDIEIRPFDIIDVPLKGQAKRTMPPVVEDRAARRDRRALPVRVID